MCGFEGEHDDQKFVGAPLCGVAEEGRHCVQQPEPPTEFTGPDLFNHCHGPESVGKPQSLQGYERPLLPTYRHHNETLLSCLTLDTTKRAWIFGIVVDTSR